MPEVGKCNTSVVVTEEMLDKYDLRELGIKAGDKVRVGDPTDGKVSVQKKGGCSETSCNIKFITIDADRSFGESSFVETFFPCELGKFERNGQYPNDPTGCLTPVMEYTRSIAIPLREDKDISPRVIDAAFSRLDSNTASPEDLNMISGIISNAIKIMEEDGEETKPLKIAREEINAKLENLRLAVNKK